LENMQKSFRQVYMLAPASYGHALTAEMASRHPTVPVMTFSDNEDAVGASVRLVDALAGGGEGEMSTAEVDEQRLAAVVGDAAIVATMQAAEMATGDVMAGFGDVGNEG
ncbi:hypothetical protein Agub_g2060, partial [Astrephomene gubernaculifera]